MKKMKIKRFLSLLLALVMSLSMAVPAFAADGPDDPDAGIMPLSVTLYENRTINEQTRGSYTSDRVTSTPGNGPYIKVWYRNNSTTAAVNVYLWRADRTTYVRHVQIAPGASDEIWYNGSNAASVTYYVTISSVNSYSVQGHLAIAQKLNRND